MAKGNDILCVLWTLFTVGINLATALTGRSACSDVRIAYGAKGGLSTNDVPQHAIPGNDLRICSNTFSCCTPKMESKLASMAVRDFEEKIFDKTSLLRDFFVRRTQKFDDYMKELILISQQDLNEMFLNTYGVMYRDNDDLFMDLFSNLRQYYFGVDIDLDQVMDDFFFLLFQKMFELLNTSYEYTDDFWTCTGRYMEEFQPFGNIPQKLTVQVRRSITAARTFVQGLGFGRDVIATVSKVTPTASCEEAVTRMTQCGACNGHTDVLPCYSFCQNVMRGCLASIAELQKEWSKYVEAMSNLALRLEEPFNVQAVLTNIDLEISNAIMTMQDNALALSPQVMEGCGPLQTKRQKRASRGQSGGSRKNRFRSHPSSPSADLVKLLKDVRKKLKEWDRIWQTLPYNVCDDENVAADVSDSDHCWNGNSIGPYPHEMVGHGVASQSQNPELSVNLSKPSYAVRREIAQLRTITHQVNNAVNGRAADYLDTEYTSASGSGEGSSSGEQPSEFPPVVDPKYRPTVTPTDNGGAVTVTSWTCVLAFLLAAIVLRW